MKLNRLDACEDWKVVRWCMTQASVTIRKASLMASLMVDDAGVSTVSSDSGVDKAGMSGTRQERSTLLLNGSGLGWLFAELLLQDPNQSQ